MDRKSLSVHVSMPKARKSCYNRIGTSVHSPEDSRIANDTMKTSGTNRLTIPYGLDYTSWATMGQRMTLTRGSINQIREAPIKLGNNAES